MTIICIKDGVVAADTATWSGEMRVANRDKLVRSVDGAAGAVVGLTVDALRFGAWFKETNHPTVRKWPDAGATRMQKREHEESYAIWLETDGSIWHWGADDLDPHTIGETICAWGCGSDFALGLMMAGMSAEDAVRCCFLNVAHTGGSCTTMTVERLPDGEAVEQNVVLEPHDYGEDEQPAPHTSAWRERFGLVS